MGGLGEHNWVKVPDGHMWLMVTFSIRFDDRFGGDAEGEELSKRADLAFDEAEVGMSDELRSFLDGCIGRYYINKKQIKLGFELNEDLVRYNLSGITEREHA